MNTKLPALTVVFLLLSWVPAATANVSAIANASPATGILIETEITFTWTKNSNSALDGEQTGTVSGQILGPTQAFLDAQSYMLPAGPTGGSVSVSWTFTFHVPGTYHVTFDDAVVAGLAANAEIPNLVVGELPSPPPSNGVTYNEDGEAVSRNWGDFLLVPNGQNQASRTYLKLHNPGSQDASFFALFHDTKFRAPNGDSIQLAGNVAFQVGLGETPRSGLSTLGASSGRFSMTVAAGQTVWLGYVVLQLPATMSANLYLAPYTLGGQP